MRRLQPGRQGADWAGVRVAAERDADLAAGALLVGLGARQRDDHALGDELDVLDVDADQLGAPEGAGEAHQQESAIALALEAARQVLAHDRPQVGDRQRGLGVGGGALLAAKAGERLVDE